MGPPQQEPYNRVTPNRSAGGTSMEMAFTRWYPLPYPLAFWEVLAALGSQRFRTVHCDPRSGWVLADTSTMLTEVGLVDISVTAVQPYGANVSASAIPYWSVNESSMQSGFNRLVATMDQMMMMRAHHYAGALQAAEAQGRTFDLERGTDLDSHAKVMGRPRALGAIALALLLGFVFLLPIPLQGETWEMMVYVLLATPFFVSAALLLAGMHRTGGRVFLGMGMVVTVFFLIFASFVGLLFFLPTWKGASKAFRADHLTGRWSALSEGSRSRPKAIEFEHR